jgi:hypothetical protein
LLSIADWLENDGAVANGVAKSHVRRTLPLMICRDICNGIKARGADEQSEPTRLKIGREYRGGFFIAFAWDDPAYLNAAAPAGDVHRRADLYAVQDLSTQCIDAWEAFFLYARTRPRVTVLNRAPGGARHQAPPRTASGNLR